MRRNLTSCIPGLSNYTTPGFYWDIKTYKHINNPKYLESYGAKVYSQNDEDGIISEIFRRIGCSDKRFIEFGVSNGLECNSHCLLFRGWSGLWIEGDSSSYEQICTKFDSVINKNLLVHNEFITCENVNQIFLQYQFEGEIDLLSIDVDGNDYHIFNKIDSISPRVVVIEYNGKFPPDVEWIMEYDPTYCWNGTDKHGASLKSLEKLAGLKGYQLVGTNAIGVNAFFVRKDLANRKFPLPATSENLYNPMRVFSNLRFQNSHPPSKCLIAATSENSDNSTGHQDFIYLYKEELKCGEIKLTSETTSLTLSARESGCFSVSVANYSKASLSSFNPYPVHISYHIDNTEGDTILNDGARTALPYVLYSGMGCSVLCSVEAPENPGSYTLRVTLVKEQCFWFEDHVKDIILPIPLYVE